MALRYLTAGESHGKALVGILEGLPSGLPITTNYIQAQMNRRKLGYGRGKRQSIETDSVEILGGVRCGKTIGSPVALLIPNKDLEKWGDAVQGAPRPGHADLVGSIKYRHHDLRNVLERASARETAMRVALAGFARKLLEEIGITLASRVVRIGGVKDASAVNVPWERLNGIADLSPVRCLGSRTGKKMIAAIDKARREGDTLGGIFEVYAAGLPAGLGSYVHWDRRLEGKIAAVFLALNAIKGVEIGIGFGAASLKGRQVHDEYFCDGSPGKIAYRTNRSGGIDGGMSTGQPVVVRAAMKPLPTLRHPLSSIDMRTGKKMRAHIQRSDVCAVPAAAVIGESLLALVFAEMILEKFGSDSMEELKPRIKHARKEFNF